MTLNHRRRVRKWTRAEKITRCVPRVRSLINHSSGRTRRRQLVSTLGTHSRRDRPSFFYRVFLDCRLRHFVPRRLCKSPTDIISIGAEIRTAVYFKSNIALLPSRIIEYFIRIRYRDLLKNMMMVNVAVCIRTVFPLFRYITYSLSSFCFSLVPFVFSRMVSYLIELSDQPSRDF